LYVIEREKSFIKVRLYIYKKYFEYSILFYYHKSKSSRSDKLYGLKECFRWIISGEFFKPLGLIVTVFQPFFVIASLHSRMYSAKLSPPTR